MPTTTQKTCGHGKSCRCPGPAFAPSQITPPAASAPSPNNPTVIEEQLKPNPIQYVRIDPEGAQTEPLVDVIALLDQLEPVRDHLADQVKAMLLSKRIGNAVGQTADGKLSLAAVPRVISTRSFLRVIAELAKSEKKDLLKLLLEMESCITINKTALAKFMGSADIDKLCTDGDPKLPSLTIKPTSGGAEDPAAALRQLSARQRTDPALFVVPDKVKEKKDPNAPRVAYV